ncbi:MAG: M48 family metalloprotease [Archangium sp.]|nr:M48 family metalloprotease [Archangium sp.]
MRSSVFAIALVVLGCAPAAKTVTPEEKLTSASAGSGLSPQMMAAMANAQKMASMSQAARAAAEGACAALLRHTPSWDEERAIGQWLAINAVARQGHLFLDGAEEKDPAKLNERLATRKAVALPEGGRNAVSAHVALVGKNLARFSSRPEVPWVFGVIENETPDALSTAGGYVFVTTGLLKKMTNEAQLAGVLAHEIGHVVHKHSLTKYLDARHKQCIAAKYAAYLIEHGTNGGPAVDELARFARNFDDPDLGAADAGFARFIMQALVTLQQFGTDGESELQTDRTALELVSFAGYDATEYEKFLTTLGDRPQHPKAVDRVAKLKALREGELKAFAHGTAKPDLAQVFAPLSP